MKDIVVYEGMMCCSSGMCGPEPDQELIESNNALEALKKENINIKRVNLSSHIALFNKNKDIINEIQKLGVKALPITLVGNKIMMRSKYPEYEELKKFAGGKN